ncbi:MBL fold metallo-hydrolase [Flexibacterium corallicola]|uniref:MBL fold metallo-hydrolase n=1 Tax=Flexibacterium corallicola TaxID=3037259 RepID=UPI00286F2BDF|nr:MBL fold metallo-hydrolase [Pseudovibrio sp. M1P-2-3]
MSTHKKNTEVTGNGLSAFRRSARRLSRQVRSLAYSRAIPTNYFSQYDGIGPKLYQVNGLVYAYEHKFARSMILRSPEGIAVFDCFSLIHAKGMKQALAKTFPDEKVRWLVYSHNHLDHIRGSELFEGAEVIGHRDINMLVADWPKLGANISKVTQPIEGDTRLSLGGVEIDALYMPWSHSQTLYAFHVLQDDVVFAPDMMFVNLVPPFDFPDFYSPGYIRALNRLVDLNAQFYIPSHGVRGDLSDLKAFRDMTVEFEQVIQQEILHWGVERMDDTKIMRKTLKSSYEKLQPKYGRVHGFEAFFVAKFGRHYGGAFLGY